MKLTYRGVSYDYTPSPSLTLGATFAEGSYRGVSFDFRPIENAPENPGVDLMWRGVRYHSGKVAAAGVVAPVADMAIAPSLASVAEIPVLGMSERARSLILGHHRRIRRREQGMLMRMAQKVGVPLEQVAHYESQIQGKIPHDFAGYDDSHCAMS